MGENGKRKNPFVCGGDFRWERVVRGRDFLCWIKPFLAYGDQICYNMGMANAKSERKEERT